LTNYSHEPEGYIVPDNRRALPGRSYTLRFILAAAFGTLVAVSVGAVLFISVGANFRNTYSLLNERAITLLNGMEQAIRVETGRAEGAVNGLAQMFDDGIFDVGDKDKIDILLRALLASEEKIEGLLIIDLQGKALGLLRDGQRSINALALTEPGPELVNNFKAAIMSQSGRPVWGEPAVVGDVLYHNVSRPLVRDGVVKGLVIAVLGRSTMNSVISELGQSNDTTAFVLNGNNAVIGHSRLTGLFNGRNAIPLANVPDRALAQFAQAVKSDEFAEAAARGISVYGTQGRGGYVFITKQLPGYASAPYTLGAYFLKADIGSEIARAMLSLGAGLAGLAAAVIAAILLGKRISAPMTRIADTAELLSEFEIDKIKPLPRSYVREIDNQAVALNRMHMAIREFSRYVPRTLVARLVRLGTNATMSVEREVTILFSDIAGFTSLSERMDAAETAAVLNEHFDIVCSCIEATGGTVDKFLGDGVMAFWGAPEDDAGHAKNAIKAAREIMNAIAANNSLRVASGKPPIRLRIGIHTGRAVVGNIGGGGRQNYTLVGDSVNVAQRLEQMGRDLMGPDDDAMVLVSSAVMNAVGGEAHFIPAGTHILRGRERPIAVGMLDLKEKDSEKIVPFPKSHIPHAG
jgi:adenylate cyclase